MAAIFEFHGMQVSIASITTDQIVKPDVKPIVPILLTARTTNSVLNDLRLQNMAHLPDDLVQRPHHFAIVDEVDSVWSMTPERRR